jgi:nitroreductase
MDALEALIRPRDAAAEAHPIPEDLIKKVIHAATCASSPGNSQGWDFVVVRDPAARKKIGDLIRETVLPRLVPIPESGGVEAGRRKMMSGARHLAGNFGAAPVIVFVCGASIYPPGAPMDEFVPAALYPAAQNLIVAARSVGLGTVFTTFHMFCAAELTKILGTREPHPGDDPMGWPGEVRTRRAQASGRSHPLGPVLGAFFPA